MNEGIIRITKTTLITVLLLSAFVSLTNAHTNSPDKTTFEVLTHIVVGTNSLTAGDPLSPKIAVAMSNIQKEFSYSNYHVGLRHFQTVTNGGSVSLKSPQENLGAFSLPGYPIFTEWRYGPFDAKPNSHAVELNKFSFQARIPVKRAGTPEKEVIISYESINLSLSNVMLKFGEPKLVASLPMPNAGESLFFVIEVRKNDDENVG